VTTDTAPPPVAEAPRPDPDDVGPSQAITLLFDEARAAVEEEVALAKAFATVAGLTARTVAICAVLAIILALVALMALAVGAMLSLAPLVGMPLATLITSGTLLLIAAIVGVMARRAVMRFKAAMTGDNHDG
jgi:hypothetical protein